MILSGCDSRVDDSFKHCQLTRSNNNTSRTVVDIELHEGVFYIS
jgi:hypothetical protein